MTTRVLDRYSCVCSARANRNWRNSSLISSLIIAAFIIVSGAFLSGCAGVTSAKGSGSATATTSDTTTSGASGTLSVSPAAVSFGNVAVGSTSNQSLSVTNSGTVALTISQVTVTGPGFSMGGASLPLTLSPGNTFTFTASFDPIAAGNVSGSFSIVSPQLSSPMAISTSGTGLAVAPAITSQPLSQSVLVGQTATFSVTASGTAPLSYQWRKNGAAISGATSSSYTTPAETTSDNGAQFTVVVSNTAGSVTSGAATLGVTAAPVAPSITSQPANQTTFAGQTATFSVIASGTVPLSYQWQKNGAAIGGAISSSYTTPAEITSDNGAQFTVVISNAAGTILSNAATLTVNPDPVAPSITAQPASQTINAGQTATFSVTATGTAPLSYQWQKNSAAISGATSSSYTTPAETASDNGAQFSVVVSNSAGTVTSNAAILTVNAPPAVTAQPVNQTVAVGQTATFSVTATGTAPLSYQWRKNGANISGATASAYTTPATASTDNGAQFSVVISNAAGSVTSNTATLTVNVPPSITTQPSSVTITAGQTATFSVTATGTAPLTYQWKKNGTSISGATSASYTTPAETTADNGAQFTVVVSNSVGNVTSNAATLTVNPAPVAPSITTQPSNVTITSGQTATFSVTATGTAPLSYQWSQNGTAISGATSSSYTTPAETTSASGAQFTVVVSNSVGSVTSNAATLTVNPAPVAPSITTQPSSVTITAGQTATFSVTATGTAPLTYQWQKNGAAISGATAASYTTPAETTADNGAQFTVVVSNSVGNVTSNAATLTVNPAPVAPSITTQPSSVTITAGQDGHVLGDRHGHSAPELSVEPERNRHQRSDLFELHHADGNDFGQRRAVHRRGQQFGWKRHQQRRDAHGQSRPGGAFDHHAALQRDDHRRADGHVLCDRHGHSAAELSVEPERNRHQRSDLFELHHARGNNLGQWRAVHGHGQQFGRQRHQQRRDAHGQSRPGSAFDHHAAFQRDHHLRTDGHVLCDRHGHSAAELSVEARTEQPSAARLLRATPRPPKQPSANGAQFTVVVSNSVGNVTSNAATLTVNPAPVAPSITTQPSSVTITAGQTATFSVTATGTAPLTYQWSQNGTAISGATSSSYTTPDGNDFSQRRAVHRRGQQFGRQRHQQCRDAHGQSRPGSAFDHHAALQRDDHRRADGHVLCDRHGHGAAQLSVEPERNRHQRSDIFELHHAGGNDFSQRRAVHRRGQQFGWKRHQQRRDTHGQSRPGSAFDHHAALQRDDHRRANGHVLCDRHGHGAAHLPMEEERNIDKRRDFRQLYNARRNHRR